MDGSCDIVGKSWGRCVAGKEGGGRGKGVEHDRKPLFLCCPGGCSAGMVMVLALVLALALWLYLFVPRYVGGAEQVGEMRQATTTGDRR